MMTVRAAQSLTELNVQTNRYHFINQKILQGYITLGILPTQRDIARKYGRNEASISRTMKQFLEKVKVLLDR
ncbi:MAG: hypothetical protein Q4B85_13765, partial [Lachnospiraceae bacterium]|nr:hypothetical protein [Lachnospiraceae bacterium]